MCIFSPQKRKNSLFDFVGNADVIQRNYLSEFLKVGYESKLPAELGTAKR